jgi:hypothetical protein
VSSLKEEGDFWGNWARGIANCDLLIVVSYNFILFFALTTFL